MDFIVKDLMISVLPLRPSGFGGLRASDVGGCHAGACTTCTGMTNCPGGCTIVTPHPPELYAQVSDPAALALLKQQLREALAAVEAREKAVYEALRPKSATQIEFLRSHLEAALEELKKRSNDLERQESEPQQI